MWGPVSQTLSHDTLGTGAHVNRESVTGYNDRGGVVLINGAESKTQILIKMLNVECGKTWF